MAPKAALRVLLVHNHYQRAGGEDRVFEVEGHILEAYGHTVARLTLDNAAVETLGRLRLAATTVWSAAGRRAVEAAARAHRADVVHFHNTLPLVSPAGYYGARAAGAAVVQTLHNYRLICPGALLHRSGAPCEACVGRAFALPGVVHGCYRGSRAATLAVAATNTVHGALGTWTRAVDRYVAITPFARDRFVEGGLPADKIAVKPNPLAHDPGEGEGNGGYALFVGRLDTGKGVETLLTAWEAHASLPPLVVVGDGPERDRVQAAADRLGGRLSFLGWQDTEAVMRLVGDARVLVFPSELYEGGTPMTIVEAFARGLPVVASDRGAARGLVAEGVTGRRFVPGDPDALAAAVEGLAPDADTYREMRRAARRHFNAEFAPAPNHDALQRIYLDALATAHAAGGRPVH